MTIEMNEIVMCHSTVTGCVSENVDILLEKDDYRVFLSLTSPELEQQDSVMTKREIWTGETRLCSISILSFPFSCFLDWDQFK